MIGIPKAENQTVTPEASRETGMRRVCWVRIMLRADGARCEVLGVGHRLPSVRRVTLNTALALAANGVPTVVRSVDGTSEQLLAAG